MPLMGKSIDITDFAWLRETGVSADQLAPLWVFGSGEAVPEAGGYRNLASGGEITLDAGDRFPDGRFVRSNDLPSPRFKDLGDPDAIEHPAG